MFLAGLDVYNVFSVAYLFIFIIIADISGIIAY